MIRIKDLSCISKQFFKINTRQISLRMKTSFPTLSITSLKNDFFLESYFEQFDKRRNFSVFSKSPDYSEAPQMNLALFEETCSDTLEALTDYFEEIVEADSKLENSDITYSDGVLTVKLGNELGTYVINRQTPNRQIWLSSPTSGPKRYDWIDDNWIYKHDGVSLHNLLQNELEKVLSVKVDFLKLSPREEMK